MGHLGYTAHNNDAIAISSVLRVYLKKGEESVPAVEKKYKKWMTVKAKRPFDKSVQFTSLWPQNKLHSLAFHIFGLILHKKR